MISVTIKFFIYVFTDPQDVVEYHEHAKKRTRTRREKTRPIVNLLD